MLHPWMPLMKISLGLLKLIELLICFLHDEVIFSALHTSALEQVRQCSGNGAIRKKFPPHNPRGGKGGI